MQKSLIRSFSDLYQQKFLFFSSKFVVLDRISGFGQDCCFRSKVYLRLIRWEVGGVIQGGSVALCSVTLGIFSFRILQSQVYH